MPAAKSETTIIINPIKHETIRVTVLGERLLCNKMSEKARRELLLPAGPKNAAARASSLKHDPLTEFRNSPYTLPDDDAPTYLAGLSVWFKRAAQSAALRLPGTSKTAIGQLVWAGSERIPVYGTPKLHMAVTRSADIARTPDVRTRAIVPAWTCELEISFVVPLLTRDSVLNLLVAAGVISGVGDDRQEKGHDNCGSFTLVNDDDPRVLAVRASGGRAQQLAAMESPECYDDEARALLSWFDETVQSRGKSDLLSSLKAA